MGKWGKAATVLPPVSKLKIHKLMMDSKNRHEHFQHLEILVLGADGKEILKRCVEDVEISDRQTQT